MTVESNRLRGIPFGQILVFILISTLTRGLPKTNSTGTNWTDQSVYFGSGRRVVPENVFLLAVLFTPSGMQSAKLRRLLVISDPIISWKVEFVIEWSISIQCFSLWVSPETP